MRLNRKNKDEEAKDPADPATEPAAAAPVQKDDEEPLKLQILRLQADFDNFRKRTQRERNELFTFANESIISEILPVLDHFEMGFKSAEAHQTDSAVTEGFRMVYNQLIDVMKKFNATPIDAVGEAFDPHRHEAILHMPSDKPAETVVEQVRRGYMLGEKLLRAAQVIISSGTPAEQKEAE
jgi:molecular chaperone GrpE